MDHFPHIHKGSLHQRHHTGDLQTAAGGPGAAAHEHQQHKHRLGIARPLVKIHRGIAGGGDDGGHLEKGVAQRSPHRAVQMADIGRDGNGGKGHDAQIRP